MEQLDLLSYTPTPRYPQSPGHRRVDTSVRAANTISPCCTVLRLQIMSCLRGRGDEGGTPDEIAIQLGQDILNVRPRFSELKKMGKIADTGDRRANCKGNTQRVWRAL